MPSLESEAPRLSDPKQLTHFMHQDKKNEAGHITLILVRAIGDAFVQKGVSGAAVETFLTSLSETEKG
jgi:3-dehydroquinate synthase